MKMAKMPTAIPRAIYVLSISVKPVGIGGASAPFASTLSICKVIGYFKLYSQLSLSRTPLGPVVSVRLIESQINGITKGRDQF